MEQIEEYQGKKYKKVFDNTDNINACIKCCFCLIDENGLPECDAPDEDRFNGCANGKFHWELLN